MNNRENILERLNQLNIPYELKEHTAAFTMDELEALGLNSENTICKNLFLRDYKGKRHMLVALRGDKQADLVLIRSEINSTRLSFASAERLEKHLKVSQGSVSPLGLINDESTNVEVYFDKDLKGAEKLGFHPNDNTATVYLSFESLEKYIDSTNHKIHFITV